MRGQPPSDRHAYYSRTLVDAAFDGVIHVRRNLCRSCKRTVSLLPESAISWLRFSVSVIAVTFGSAARIHADQLGPASSHRASAPPSASISAGCPSITGRVLTKSSANWLPTKRNPLRQSPFMVHRRYLDFTLTNIAGDRVVGRNGHEADPVVDHLYVYFTRLSYLKSRSQHLLEESQRVEFGFDE